MYEASAAGLTLNIEKCRLGPATKFTFLGITIDTASATFSLPQSRAHRLTIQVRELSAATAHFDRVQAREVAQLLGLLWSASPCCPRGIAIMARGLVDVLAKEMRASMYNLPPALRPRYNPCGRHHSNLLRRILASFWSGTVAWSPEAADDLAFWAAVDFNSLSAPISSDTLNVSLTATFALTDRVPLEGVSYLATDASDVACGGGMLVKMGNGFTFVPGTEFISDLPPHLRDQASAVREATAIEWILRSLPHRLKRRVVAFSDSKSACNAILRGSRAPALQAVVRRIFVWCLRHGITLFPCWVPRESAIITEADTRSRVVDVYDQRTPRQVFARADQLARRYFGRPISFDRQASHLNAMPPAGMGPRLPFNSMYWQPGSHGVDMFFQPRRCWLAHINFIHPATPTVGRTIAFIRDVGARAVVVVPATTTLTSWWGPELLQGSDWVLHTEVVSGFRVTLFGPQRR